MKDKIWIFLLVGLTLALNVAAKPPEKEDNLPLEVLPDITNEIPLSNRQTNWFRCQDSLTDVAYSKEKNLEVTLKGKNGYVKFLEKRGENGEPVFQSGQTELIFNCSGTMYKLLVTPKNISSRTVLLARGQSERMEKNLIALAPKSEDERILELLKKVYLDRIPEGWEVSQGGTEVSVYKGLSAELKREVHVEGTGYKVLEYVLESERDGFELEEKLFNRVEFAKNPVAIAVDPLHLDKGEKARLLVVERLNQDRGLPLVVGKAGGDKPSQETPPVSFGNEGQP